MTGDARGRQTLGWNPESMTKKEEMLTMLGMVLSTMTSLTQPTGSLVRELLLSQQSGGGSARLISGWRISCATTYVVVSLSF